MKLKKWLTCYINLILLWSLAQPISASENEGQEKHPFDPQQFKVGGSTLATSSDFIKAMAGPDGEPSVKQFAMFGYLIEDYILHLKEWDVGTTSSEMRQVTRAIWDMYPRFTIEWLPDEPEARLREYQRIWFLIYVNANMVRRWGQSAAQNINIEHYLTVEDSDTFGRALYVDIDVRKEQMWRITNEVMRYIEQLKKLGAFDDGPEDIEDANFVALHSIRQEIMMGWVLYMHALVHAYDPEAPSYARAGGMLGVRPPEPSQRTVYANKLNSHILAHLGRMHRLNGKIYKLFHNFYDDHNVQGDEFVQFMRLSNRRLIFDRLRAHEEVMKGRSAWLLHYPTRAEGWTGIIAEPDLPKNETDEKNPE